MKAMHVIAIHLKWEFLIPTVQQLANHIPAITAAAVKRKAHFARTGLHAEFPTIGPSPLHKLNTHLYYNYSCCDL